MNIHKFFSSSVFSKVLVVLFITSFFISPVAIVFAQKVMPDSLGSESVQSETIPDVPDLQTQDNSETIIAPTDQTNQLTQIDNTEVSLDPTNPVDLLTDENDLSVKDAKEKKSLLKSMGPTNIWDPVALSAEPTQSQLVPEPDLSTGALVYKYQIQVPPGRNGMQPDLKLQYNSQSTGQNSIFGYGWSINIPYISRVNKGGVNTIFTDNYFNSSLSGDLINTSGSAYSPSTETGDFTKYNYSGNTWTATDKNGTIYTFGSGDSTRQNDPNNSAHISKWMLEKVQDMNGNFISYTYYKNSGQIYPDTITYTSNGGDTGIFTIIFSRESRNDTVLDISSGFAITTNYRISRIESAVSGTWVHRYDLAYTTQSPSNRSLLYTVTESGQKNSTTTTLPAETFNYQNTASGSWTLASPAWSMPADEYSKEWYGQVSPGNNPQVNGHDVSVSFNTAHYSDGSVSGNLVDVNGDGLLDIVQSFRCFSDAFCMPTGHTGIDASYIYINNGNGWTYDSSWVLPTDEYSIEKSDQSSNSNPQVGGHDIRVSLNTSHNTDGSVAGELIDVNGDGLVDIVQSARCIAGMSSSGICIPSGQPGIDGAFIYLNTGSGWVYDSSWTLPSDQYSLEYSSQTSTSNPQVNGHDVSVSLNTSRINDTSIAGELVDVNGDGLVDILQSNRCVVGSGCAPSGQPGIDGAFIYLNTGSGWVYDSSWVAPADEYSKALYAQVDPGNNPQVNGHDIRVSLSTAHYNDGSISATLSDVNGDGLIDIIQSNRCMVGSCVPSGNPGIDDVYVYINNGSGWIYDSSWVAPADEYSKTLYGQASPGNNPQVNGHDIRISLNTSFYSDNSISGKLFDVNNDGLVDLVQSSRCVAGVCGIPTGQPGIDGVFVYLNTGTSWVYDSSWSMPTDAYSLEWHNQMSSSNPQVNGHDVSVSLNMERNSDGSIGGGLMDVNGDGKIDIIQSNRCVAGFGCISSGQLGIDGAYIYISSAVAPLLSSVTVPEGGSYTFTYMPAQLYVDDSGNHQNVNSPYIVQTLNQVAVNDGLGNTNTTSYSYSGGKYYFDSLNKSTRKFAGFNVVVKTDPIGNIIKTYYHQGDSSDSSHGEYNDDYYKIGEAYRTEQFDSSNNLYSKTINKWDEYSLGIGTKFVKLAQTAQSTYGGDSSRKDKAVAYTYDNATGNVTQKIEYGLVNGSNDGTFSDTGTDDFTTAYSYTNNTIDYIFLSYDVTVTDHSSSKVKEDKYYYDTQSLGTVTKGNQTKNEKWKTSSTYINTQKSYNSTYGVVLSDTDARGKVTSYTLDSNHIYPATVTDPLSNATSYTYDYASGQVIQKTDPNNFVFQWVYDGLGRIITIKQPDLTTPATLVSKTVYAYTDTSGAVQVQQTNYLDGSISVNNYTYFDGLHRKLQKRKQTENSNYETKDFAYNSVGLLQKESFPYFSSGSSKTSATATSSLYTNYTYDPIHRMVTVVDNVGTTSNTYSDWKLTVTDPRGKVKDYYQDAYGNLTQVDEHNSGNTYSTYYTYNGLSNLLSITDALSNVRNFTYDGLGRRLTAEDLHASGDATYGSWSYTYDDAGNMTQSVSPEAKTTNYTYDDLSRELTENYTGAAGIEISYAYDSCTNGVGKLCSVTMTSSANTSYTYDANGNIASEAKTINSNTYTTSYTYDRQGNQLVITYPDNAQVRYIYNSAGLLNQIERKESGGSFTNVISNIDYSPTEQTTIIAYANGLNTINVYDSAKQYRLTNKITSTLTEFPAFNNNPVITLTGATLINKNVGDTWTEPGYSAADTEDGNLTSSVSVTGSVNTGIAGTYQLVYAVVDSHGLSAARMIRTVVVHVVNNPTLTVKTLVVGGGGGGANTFGGGGAGGYRYDSAHAITSGTHSITVGAGGLGSANSDGGSSVFDTITSIGGGAASNGYVGGHNGASGGGGYGGYTPVSNGGTGTSGQGSNGGNSTSGTGGGGGGSSATGTNGASRVGGSGGNGTSNSITGSSIIYAGGGAGRGQNGNGTSGTGGGGVVGSSGAVNTGGGAGASNGTAMDGGSGVVIISYHTDGSDGLSNTSTGGTKTTSGAYTIHTFTSSGTFTANVYTPANDNPIITLTSSNLIEKTVGDTWTEPGYSAADTEDGNLTSSVSVTGSVNTGIAGTYQLVYAVVDSQGAQAARIIRTVVVFPANDPQTIDYKQNIAYTYDANGNITQAVDASNTNASKTVTYTYDDLNRMTQAVATNVASGQSTYTQNFTYNAIGNIITGPVGSYTYAGNSGTNYANPHAATSINSVTNTYDHDGNVLTDGTLTNTWNYKDQLTETTNGTFTRDYKYDEGGNRVSSTDGTTTTVYLNKYYNNDGTRKTKSIYAGDQLFATIETVDTVVTPYYDHADYLNSVAVVSDSNGSSVQILDYMPYGSQRINSGSKNLDRQYLSQIYDSDSSLNYLRARFYQSLTGRFISEDPMFWQLPKELLLDPQQQNSYSYGRDNPISVSDPSGKVSTWALFNPLTYLQVGIGSLISDAYASLRPNQSRATTELFSRSLSINPSNLTITENSNDSYIINQIKNSSEYNAFINNVISNADKNGDSSINAIYKGSSAGSSGDSIGFTKGDLFTAIGGTLSTQVNGQKQKDGSWNLNLGIQDRYNFQPKDYKNVAANTANNTALIPQALGVVSNYNININFKDTKKK